MFNQNVRIYPTGTGKNDNDYFRIMKLEINVLSEVASCIYLPYCHFMHLEVGTLYYARRGGECVRSVEEYSKPSGALQSMIHLSPGNKNCFHCLKNSVGYAYSTFFMKINIGEGKTFRSPRVVKELSVMLSRGQL